MLSTVSSTTVELNTSYYTTLVGSSALDGFSVSVIEPENITSTPYMLPTYIRITSMIVCIIVMVLGIIGNLMVPLVVLRGKDMRNSTNIFLVNLSVADLCVLLFCTPTVLVEVNSGPQIWPLGEHMCKAVPFVELTVAHASVLTILAISFERYYAICEPLRAGYVCTKTRATFLCFLAWVFAALYTSPMIWVTQYRHIRVNITVTDDGLRKEGEDREAIITMPTCLMQATTPTITVFFLLIVFLFFLLPVALLVVLYSFIICHLVRDSSTGNSNTSGDSYQIRTRKQVVLMLLVVVISFFFCLLPFNALTLYIVLAPNETVFSIDEDTYFIVLYFSRIMFYLNSAINPILYNLMSSKFRKGFFSVCAIGTKRIRSQRTTVLRSTVTGVRRFPSNDQQENFL